MSIAQVRRAALVITFLAAFAPVFLGGLIAQSAAPPIQAPASGASVAAPSNGGKPIAIEDYARFKRIAGATLSSDGKWMAYTVTPNEGDGTLFIQALDVATKHEVARGTSRTSSILRRVAGAARDAARRRRRAALPPRRPLARSNCSI